jgi:hypothetical protein
MDQKPLSRALRCSCPSETTVDAGALRALGSARLPTAITLAHCVRPVAAPDTSVLRELLMLAAGGVVAGPAGSDARRDELRALRTPGLGALVTGDSDAGRDASGIGLHGRAAVVFARNGVGAAFSATVADTVAGVVGTTGIGMTNPGLFPRRTWSALRCRGSSGVWRAYGGTAITHVGVAGTHIL